MADKPEGRNGYPQRSKNKCTIVAGFLISVSHEGTDDLFPTAKHNKFALFLSTSMADYKKPALKYF
ncbi:hypothetical protein, partial [Sphingobium sp. D43FB]|uniref:hypothetical protein n=1 Tax=Sphingobium sp. D43FB TaxID=2017595 RepID=UPI001C3EA448